LNSTQTASLNSSITASLNSSLVFSQSYMHSEPPTKPSIRLNIDLDPSLNLSQAVASVHSSQTTSLNSSSISFFDYSSQTMYSVSKTSASKRSSAYHDSLESIETVESIQNKMFARKSKIQHDDGRKRRSGRRGSVEATSSPPQGGVKRTALSLRR
jgi:hypothetical protein